MFVVLLISDVLLICCAVITHKEAYCVFKKKKTALPKGLYTVFLSAAGSLVVECVLGDVGYMRHQVNLADILW